MDLPLFTEYKKWEDIVNDESYLIVRITSGAIDSKTVIYDTHGEYPRPFYASISNVTIAGMAMRTITKDEAFLEML
jgi:hypothetical protein